MANFTPIDGRSHYILVGDGASPEVFSSPCGLNGGSFSPNLESRKTKLYDCDNHLGANETHTTVFGSDYTVSDSGLLSLEADATWREWYSSKTPRNIRYKRVNGYYEGPAVLTAYSEDFSREEDVAVSIQVDFNGEPVWVPNP